MTNVYTQKKLVIRAFLRVSYMNLKHKTLPLNCIR